jgi:hypothetical protein
MPGEWGDGFAGAGFSDDAQRLSALDMKGDILDRPHNPRPGVEGCAQVVDAKKYRTVFFQRRLADGITHEWRES